MASPTSPVMWPLSLILLLPLLFFILKKKIQDHIRQRKHLPPGPPRLPIIGNLHQLGVLPHQSLWNFSKKYGPVMLLQLGRVPVLIVSSADAAKEVLKTHDINTCSRPLLAGTGKLSYNYLDVAFTPYGDYWREMRKICVLELFSAKRVQSFQFVREEEIDLLIDSIYKSSSSATAVDLSEKTLSLTANITCRVAFGKGFQERGLSHERFQEVIHEGLAMLGSFSAADFFPYVGWIVDRLTGLHARLERNFQEFDVFYQKVIDDHIQKGTKEPGQEDIIDVLLRLERFQTESGTIQFSEDHIKAILMDSDYEISLSFVLACKTPQSYEKSTRRNQNLRWNKRKVSESDIEKLGYFKMVVMETLRLHPPGTLLIPRETMSQFSINGYEIQPKTRIQVNVWAIGRDPKIWRNPEEFFPERFIDNPIDFKGQNFEMLPFGGGRRGCPGIVMGLATVELALANLLFCFDWKLPFDMKVEDINMEEAAGLTVYKKASLLLVPIRYQPA
ncbi:hypothetical protein GH714_035691 [Hevea brasiliensis]|uniref:Cytochrome P450 n=1 Tax=Hevea brasiliensis TaxID=3981 RepID=A0A6A6KWI0_HEVBR|nr:hypothetical protein GH714_035691 [Hevea brasiliensis]